MSNSVNHLYEFGEFRLDTHNPGLWQNGKRVSIVPKALDVLILLVSRNGEVVSRDDLLENVWRETFVEDSNISYTISLLRKTLGEKNYIKTVPKRGYVFTGDVKRTSHNGSAPIARASETAAAKTRWVMISVLAASILFVTSFVFLPARENQITKSNGQSPHPDAAQAYARGKMILESRNVEDREQKAIDEFQRAVTLDPTFAIAYAGLAEGFTAAAGRLSGDKSRDYYAKAKTAAQKALRLDAGLTEGIAINGWLKHQADWDFAVAETDLRRAVELEPGNALFHFRLSRVLMPLGKTDEALTEILKAYEIDPVSENMVLGRFAILESRGEYDEALKLADKYFRENKNNSFAGRAYGTFLYHTGDFPKVIELGEQALEKKGRLNVFGWLSLLSASYHKTGNFDKAQETLKQLETLSRDDTKALYSSAMNYAEMGRHDEAISALQKCFDAHEERMVWAKTEPRFANLRNDEHFHEILRRMNLIN